MVFLKLNHTCLSASTTLSAKYLQFPAGDDDTSLSHRLVLLSLMKPISSSPWTHLPDFKAPNISEKHVHLQSQSQLSGQQSVTSAPCEPVGQQIRSDPRSNDCFYKNPTLRSLSGSSTVVWKLVQYKWWRTNMASSYISTPNSHSFIEFLTFPGLFSVFYSVQCPHVKSSFGQTLPGCRQLLHGASLLFRSLSCPTNHVDTSRLTVIHEHRRDELDQTQN